MSYDPRLLFEQIAACLKENPRKTLEELSESLLVSKRTIKKSVQLRTGRNFRHYREEVLMEKVKGFFAQQPGAVHRAHAPEYCGPLSQAKCPQPKNMRRSTED
ncbi:MAG: hypothetical protein DMG36_26060 [Acidobacteria bacterium]|nr:MAG: hypothetical protein DMG36_26060 [Acidobacteriota bacterium]